MFLQLFIFTVQVHKGHLRVGLSTYVSTKCSNDMMSMDKISQWLEKNNDQIQQFYFVYEHYGGDVKTMTII